MFVELDSEAPGPEHLFALIAPPSDFVVEELAQDSAYRRASRTGFRVRIPWRRRDTWLQLVGGAASVVFTGVLVWVGAPVAVTLFIGAFALVNSYAHAARLTNETRTTVDGRALETRTVGSIPWPGGPFTVELSRIRAVELRLPALGIGPRLVVVVRFDKETERRVSPVMSPAGAEKLQRALQTRLELGSG